MLRWLVFASPVMLVFLAGLVLDTAALFRLFWACLAGYLGTVPRMIAFAVLFVGASPALHAAYRYLTAPDPAAPVKAQRRARTERARTPERPPRVAVQGPPTEQRRARVVAKTD